MATYAIISEGISENLSIHAIVEKMSLEDTYFADIQPRTDMNHSHAVQEGPGGWTEVLSHCNTEVFKQALQSNDYLIIQVDTDRCDEPLFGIKKTDENNQARPDEDVYNDIIDRMLQDVDKEFYETNKHRIIFAICFEEIECWFLPLFYSDKRACATTGCIGKLNQELSKEIIIIEWCQCKKHLSIHLEKDETKGHSSNSSIQLRLPAIRKAVEHN